MDARKLMTLEVTAVSPEVTVGETQALMTRFGVRHLPVVSGGKLAGVVSDHEILAATRRSPVGGPSSRSMKVGDIMSLSPASAAAEEWLAEIAGAMFDQNVGAALLVDLNNRLVGVVTSGDLLTIVNSLHASSHTHGALPGATG